MKRKNAEIEILRAVAVLLTLVNHLPQLFKWNPHPLGHLEDYVTFWGGVDLFFCISGYVVSKSVFDLLESGKASGTFWTAVKSFWLRRAYRLLPSAWFWLAVMVACSIFFNESGAFYPPFMSIRSALAAVFISSNFAQTFGAPILPNFVYWSLSLEEQFYLLLPLFVLLVPARWRWKALLFCIAIQFPLQRTLWVDLSWFVRLDALMWGILIFLFSRTIEYRKLEPRSLKRNSKGWAFSALALLALVTLPQILSPLPFHVGLMAIVCAGLVAAASYANGYTIPCGPIRPFLLWIGSRSYAIYLVHIPAYYMTNEIWYRIAVSHEYAVPDGTYSLRFLLTALPLTFVLAEANYRLIETPFRERGARAARAIMSAALPSN
ncbi:acyltransferase family protein [Burkholderia ubonensis]|uniref:acyltransferase family protein n=1 Tax=Burkholderia ubonensis TaxID=101571 RepID=UPI0014544FB6|nr:acyltransferase [Burkholderia ubonensis]VWB83220.1 O-antigen acetylase [Burkholderia ubonensis]